MLFTYFFKVWNLSLVSLDHLPIIRIVDPRLHWVFGRLASLTLNDPLCKDGPGVPLLVNWQVKYIFKQDPVLGGSEVFLLLTCQISYQLYDIYIYIILFCKSVSLHHCFVVAVRFPLICHIPTKVYSQLSQAFFPLRFLHTNANDAKLNSASNFEAPPHSDPWPHISHPPIHTCRRKFGP